MNKKLQTILNKIKVRVEEKGADISDKDIIKTIGGVLADEIGEVEVALLGADWVNYVTGHKTKEFNEKMGELILKMAEVSKTHQEMSQVASSMVSIGFEQLTETENGTTLLDDITYTQSKKALEELESHLSLGYGVLLSNTIKTPNKLENGTLSQNASFEGALLFGVPNKETGEFAIRTLLPSVSSGLTLTENIEFSMPTELMVLAYGDIETKVKYLALDESWNIAEKGLVDSVEDIKLQHNTEKKIEKLRYIIDLQQSLGYELKALKIEERPETIINPATKEQELIWATNVAGLFLKKGNGIAPSDEPVDELKTMGWRINEYDEESAFYQEDKLDFRTLVEGNGWALGRQEMDKASMELSNFANNNLKDFLEKIKS